MCSHALGLESIRWYRSWWCERPIVICISNVLKPGGAAWVTGVHEDGSYDVKYIVGSRQDLNVPPVFVEAQQDLGSMPFWALLFYFRVSIRNNWIEWYLLQIENPDEGHVLKWQRMLVVRHNCILSFLCVTEFRLSAQRIQSSRKIYAWLHLELGSRAVVATTDAKAGAINATKKKKASGVRKNEEECIIANKPVVILPTGVDATVL